MHLAHSLRYFFLSVCFFVICFSALVPAQTLPSSLRLVVRGQRFGGSPGSPVGGPGIRGIVSPETARQYANIIGPFQAVKTTIATLIVEVVDSLNRPVNLTQFSSSATFACILLNTETTGSIQHIFSASDADPSLKNVSFSPVSTPYYQPYGEKSALTTATQQYNHLEFSGIVMSGTAQMNAQFTVRLGVLTSTANYTIPGLYGANRLPFSFLGLSTSGTCTLRGGRALSLEIVSDTLQPFPIRKEVRLEEPFSITIRNKDVFNNTATLEYFLSTKTNPRYPLSDRCDISTAVLVGMPDMSLVSLGLIRYDSIKVIGRIPSFDSTISITPSYSFSVEHRSVDVRILPPNVPVGLRFTDAVRFNQQRKETFFNRFTVGTTYPSVPYPFALEAVDRFGNVIQQFTTSPTVTVTVAPPFAFSSSAITSVQASKNGQFVFDNLSFTSATLSATWNDVKLTFSSPTLPGIASPIMEFPESCRRDVNFNSLFPMLPPSLSANTSIVGVSGLRFLSFPKEMRLGSTSSTFAAYFVNQFEELTFPLKRTPLSLSVNAPFQLSAASRTTIEAIMFTDSIFKIYYPEAFLSPIPKTQWFALGGGLSDTSIIAKSFQFYQNGRGSSLETGSLYRVDNIVPIGMASIMPNDVILTLRDASGKFTTSATTTFTTRTSVFDNQYPKSNTITFLPNPASDITTLRYSLLSSANVQVEIFDMLGRISLPPISEERSAGEQSIPFSVAGLSSGVYSVRLTVRTAAGARMETMRLVVVR